MGITLWFAKMLAKITKIFAKLSGVPFIGMLFDGLEDPSEEDTEVID